MERTPARERGEERHAADQPAPAPVALQRDGQTPPGTAWENSNGAIHAADVDRHGVPPFHGELSHRLATGHFHAVPEMPPGSIHRNMVASANDPRFEVDQTSRGTPG